MRLKDKWLCRLKGKKNRSTGCSAVLTGLIFTRLDAGFTPRSDRFPIPNSFLSP
jgi:hypothetical protein